MVPPQLCLLVYNPNNYRYNCNHKPKREIVLRNQLNANELGHHRTYVFLLVNPVLITIRLSKS